MAVTPEELHRRQFDSIEDWDAYTHYLETHPEPISGFVVAWLCVVILPAILLIAALLGEN